MIRLLLVEDHQIVREGIRILLEQEDDFEIVAEAGDGEEALSILQKGMQVDIILCDLHMPNMDGLTMAAELRKRRSGIKIILLSMMDNERSIIEAFNHGIDGYILKTAEYFELVLGVRMVMQGKPYISPELALKAFDKLEITGQRAPEEANINWPQAEVQVLALIADGLTSQEIADKLFMGKRTVEGHRQSIIEKAGVKNTAALIQYAFRNRLIA